MDESFSTIESANRAANEVMRKWKMDGSLVGDKRGHDGLDSLFWCRADRCVREIVRVVKNFHQG